MKHGFPHGAVTALGLCNGSFTEGHSYLGKTFLFSSPTQAKGHAEALKGDDRPCSRAVPSIRAATSGMNYLT